MPIVRAEVFLQPRLVPCGRSLGPEELPPHVVLDPHHGHALPREKVRRLRPDQPRRTRNHHHAHRFSLPSLAAALLVKPHMLARNRRPRKPLRKPPSALPDFSRPARVARKLLEQSTSLVRGRRAQHHLLQILRRLGRERRHHGQPANQRPQHAPTLQRRAIRKRQISRQRCGHPLRHALQHLIQYPLHVCRRPGTERLEVPAVLLHLRAQHLKAPPPALSPPTPETPPGPCPAAPVRSRSRTHSAHPSRSREPPRCSRSRSPVRAPRQTAPVPLRS